MQSDATAKSIAEVLAEFEAVRSSRAIEGAELEQARNALTRGYVRHFETPAHLVRAAAEIAAYSLPDDTFDRFVPEVSQVNAEAVLDAARRFVRPAASFVVVVGDAQKCRPDLSGLGLGIAEVTPEF